MSEDNFILWDYWNGQTLINFLEDLLHFHGSLNSYLASLTFTYDPYIIISSFPVSCPCGEFWLANRGRCKWWCTESLSQVSWQNFSQVSPVMTWPYVPFCVSHILMRTNDRRFLPHDSQDPVLAGSWSSIQGRVEIWVKWVKRFSSTSLTSSPVSQSESATRATNRRNGKDDVSIISKSWEKQERNLEILESATDPQESWWGFDHFSSLIK